MFLVSEALLVTILIYRVTSGNLIYVSNIVFMKVSHLGKFGIRRHSLLNFLNFGNRQI
jgi:hypothetical protein